MRVRDRIANPGALGAKTVTLNCAYCGIAFWVYESSIRRATKEGQTIKYCSRTCAGAAQQGLPSWNKGKKWDEEALYHMSESAKRRGAIPEAHSPEANAKRSISLSKTFKAKWSDSDYRDKLLVHLCNLNESPEHKRSSAKGGKIAQERHPEIKTIFHEAGQRFIKSLEGHKLLSQKAKEQWKKMKGQMVKAQRQGMKRPNKKESLLDSMLNQYFLGKWVYTGNGSDYLPDSILSAGLIPDFINIDGDKAVIELFGDYWHQGESGEEKMAKYNLLGYRCLVIWEHELKELAEITIVGKISEFMFKEDINV